MNISMSRLLLIAAAAFALLTAAVVGYLSWSQPLHLRVAAGPKDGIDAKLLIAFTRLLDVNRAGARLDLVTTADMHESSQLLEKREVDLAVLRLDDPLPTGAALVAMLRTNLMIAAAPARLKLETLADVKGKRLGLVSRSPLDEPSFVRLLDMVGLTPADVRMTIIKPRMSPGSSPADSSIASSCSACRPIPWSGTWSPRWATSGRIPRPSSVSSLVSP